ncbi:beta-ketoacyl synthase chain length factor [Ramlibacter sp.]|uniref:beta-ketoacyl synthase chain length factor n=1 Tax=Ramlibacter sp. TaxID=1917967 RepID=UPI0025EA975D|nr:beta-ketoacyl synthase chain length factor [Ramlibacter sp.]
MFFKIRNWAACAPGLAAAAQWHQWAQAPWLPEGEHGAALTAMPAMQRRRLGPLGRMAAAVAYDCQPNDPDMPMVFASRYGDAVRALGLLKEFAHSGAMSPADFALSVHNAIGAMYSIARSDTSAYTSVAAGPASAAAGLIEAAGLLADGAQEVMLVNYDAALPGEYAAFEGGPACAYAWAWRLSAAHAGEPRMHLSWQADDSSADSEDEAQELPFGLDAMRFVASRSPHLERRCAGRRWRWSRHA